MPPAWMWPLDKAIVEWMDRVKEERDERFNRNRDDERVPMMDNDLARRRREGKRG